MASTILTLYSMGVPAYSARGLTQTLTPIDGAAQLRRTVNGALADLSHEQFRKYSSVIRGDDQAPPAVDTVWPGATVTVDCIAELAISGNVPAVSLGRPIVTNSRRTEGGFTFYRPKLDCRVVSFEIEADEWAAGVRWTLALEEV